MIKLYWRLVYTIKEIKNEIKWAYQRIFRGYDDTAKWNFNYYSAKLIKDITFDMYNNNVGFPHSITNKEWKDILSQMSFGFGSYLEMQSGFYSEDEEEYKRLNKEYGRALKLFVKWHSNLWD